MSRRRNTEDRQRQIVASTLDLLADTPLAALSTRKIARALGLSQPALFRHFRSRDALMLAVLDQARASLGEVVEGVLEAGGDVGAQIERLVFAVLGYTEAHPGVARLLFGDGAGGAGSDEVRAALRQLVSMQRNVVAELTRVGQGRGLVRGDLSPTRAASLLVGMVQGAILQWELDGRRRSLSAEAAPLARLWFHGARAPESGPAAPPPAPASADPGAGRDAGPAASAVPRLEVLDARPLLADGEDPLEAILAAVEAAGPGGLVALTTPFLPAPLVTLLRRRGHTVEAREVEPRLHATAIAVAPSRGLLDVRDLPAPEPMETILTRAGALQPGETLAARVPRVPAPLLTELGRRGFVAAVHEEPDGVALVLIGRPPA